jgi:hypothetical protein
VREPTREEQRRACRQAFTDAGRVTYFQGLLGVGEACPGLYHGIGGPPGQLPCCLPPGPLDIVGLQLQQEAGAVLAWRWRGLQLGLGMAVEGPAHGGPWASEGLPQRRCKQRVELEGTLLPTLANPD